MALQFPSNPTNGQVFENWIWDAASNMWVCVTPAQQITDLTAPFSVYHDSAKTELALWANAAGQAGIQAWPSATALIIEPDTGQVVIGSHLGVSWLNFDPMTGALTVGPTGSFNLAGTLTVNGPANISGPTSSGATTVTSLTVQGGGTTVNDVALSVPGITTFGDGSGAIGTAPNQLVWTAAGVFSTTGTATLPGGGTGGASALAQLTDVSLTAQTDGQVLAWNAATQRWVNSAPGGTASLGQLSDVSIVTPSAGQQLVWNGSAWVNQTPPPVGGTGTVTSITAGTGLTGGTITTAGIIGLMNTPVQAGAYNSPNLTIDAQGRITAAVNGSLNTLVGPMNAAPGDLLGWNGTRWINVAPGAAAGTLASLHDVSVGNLQVDNVLSWNGAYWTNNALPLHTLYSLNDVEIAGTAVGQVLTWNGSFWQNQNPPYGGATAMSQLNDVTITGGQTNGQVLTWNATTQRWVPATPAGAGTLAALSDVALTGPAVNQTLVWNGSSWVNQSIPAVTAVFPGSGLRSDQGTSGFGAITTQGSLMLDYNIVATQDRPNYFRVAQSFVSPVDIQPGGYSPNVGNGPTGVGVTITPASGFDALVINRFGLTSPFTPGFTVHADGSGFIGAAPNQLSWNTAGVFTLTGTASLPTGSLQSLSDVGPMNLTAGDFLSWDGARWINVVAPAAPDLSNYALLNYGFVTPQTFQGGALNIYASPLTVASQLVMRGYIVSGPATVTYASGTYNLAAQTGYEFVVDLATARAAGQSTANLQVSMQNTLGSVQIIIRQTSPAVSLGTISTDPGNISWVGGPPVMPTTDQSFIVINIYARTVNLPQVVVGTWSPGAAGGGGGVSLSTANTWTATQTIAPIGGPNTGNPATTITGLTIQSSSSPALGGRINFTGTNQNWVMGLRPDSPANWSLSANSGNTMLINCNSAGPVGGGVTIGQWGGSAGGLTVYGPTTFSGPLVNSPGTANYSIDTPYPGNARWDLDLNTGTFFVVDLSQPDADGQTSFSIFPLPQNTPTTIRILVVQSGGNLLNFGGWGGDPILWPTPPGPPVFPNTAGGMVLFDIFYRGNYQSALGTWSTDYVPG